MLKLRLTTSEMLIYKETYNQVVSDAKGGKINSSTNIKDYVYNLMFQKLNGVKDKAYTKTVKINCTKDDKGNWKTDINSNVDFLDAMMGGMFTAIKSVTSQPAQ